MWHNNKAVVRTHVKNGSQQAWAIVQGVSSGWLRIKPAVADGVSNLNTILSVALANNRKVDVYVVGNEISQATLR
ncbi:hypothetical protein [Desulforapulum autotrophicum]|uniref:hypothetical protein n=1 Tax=Desulforapulum autotrophicum TaxID=2296 RepID=UPI00059CBF42|nr:hypothetical protein [Desulforapulum autotrophicum]